MPRFDGEDEEIVDFLREYERYARNTTGSVDDFSDWLEDNYGNSRKKTINSPKRRKAGDGEDEQP